MRGRLPLIALRCSMAVALGEGACSHTGGKPMHDVQHVSISIDRRPADVYEFASDPRNLPRWAAGLARSEEFTFTLIRRPGISNEKFAADKAAVEKDLKTLKELLEGKPSARPAP